MPDPEPGTPAPRSPGPEDRQPVLPPAPPLAATDTRTPTPSARWPALPALVLGLALYGLLLAYSFANRVDRAGLPWPLGLALLIGGLTIVMLVPAMLLAARRGTRFWGVGLLLGTSLGALIDSGVCITVAAR